MPPNADSTLRQRHIAAGSNLDSVDDNSPPTVIEQSSVSTTTTNKTTLHLKANEVAIDGIIYDITNFKHPGGDIVQIFGGNDVTIQYKMIHPYHTTKHLEKLKRVGTIPNYTSEYKFDTPFEREMKREVFNIVRRGKEFGTTGWFFRACCYIVTYFYLQYLWIFQGTSYALAIVYGMSQAMIGMNVQHDANHGACSGKYPIVNDLLGLGADFIGGSKWLWMEQHWTHHAYTNHPQRDPDAFGAEPFLLFHDYPLGNPKRTFIHAFQAFFYLPVLAGYWLSSVFNPEVLDLKQRGAMGVGLNMDNDFVKSRRIFAIILRLYYIFVHVVVPLFMHKGNFLTSLGHVSILGVSESLTLAVLFSLSHNFENSDRNPTNVAQSNGTDTKNAESTFSAATATEHQQVCWFTKQVETSCTYGGFISGCFTGGLNFQVEHHLFPRMSSAWYPYIAPTVRRVCAKHGVKYAYYPWIFENVMSTLSYIHAAGTGSNWKGPENPYTGRL